MWAGRSSTVKMSAPHQSSDIRKMGYLKKLKSVSPGPRMAHPLTNKKKFFLLREESEAGPARLEYYDSEKKYIAGGPAKRWIPLRTCFNINKKSDAKHKYAIALYTKEECFSMVCESDVEQEAWLSVLVDLQNDNMSEGEEPRPFFEHIWQVTVKPRGLGNGKNLTAGPYRLCLTNKTLSLVRLSQHDPVIIFQLASLRRCGHSECFFFIEAGSSAVTGAGELWMHVEDTVIARNIHETILRNMAGDQAFRPRSRSSVSDRRSTKPISVPSNSRGASPAYDSSTLPVRSKTISGDHPSSPTPPSRLRPGPNKSSSSSRTSTSSSLGRGHSPVPTSPLGHTLSEAHRSRTDSMESRGSRGTVSSLSADELDLSPHDHHSSTASTRSVTPEGSTMRDDPSYLSMTPLGSKDILVSPTSEMGPHRDGYMEMTSGMASSRDSYMDMSPGDTTYLDMARTSFSSSPAVSTASSGHDPDEHCYLDMTSIAHSLPTVQERITDAGYLDMSPGNTWAKGPMPRPERVHSYLSDDQGSTEDFPKRAYSVGSKPTSVKSRGDNSSYVDMTGKHGTLDKVNPKSSSAPHLVDKEKGGHVGQEASRTAKELAGRAAHYKKEQLMEFDFFRKDGGVENSEFRRRTSSAGREFRQRTSSIGQETRRRTGSFGKDGVSRTASMGRHDRPRTTTICQDSFRNRTSSFGSTDMRPRSSSHGSRSYYKGKVSEKGSETDSRGSSRHSSQESLRRSLHKAPEEYSVKGSQDSYMDMLMGRTPSPSVPSNTAPARASEKAAAKINTLWQGDEYLAMKPGGQELAGTSSGGPGSAGPASYMDMNYETDRHKEQRRRPSDTPTKSGESRSGKPRTRSSMKSQHHRLLLKIPSSEAKSATAADDAKLEDAQKSPGEYIDIAFTKPSAKGSATPLGKQKSYDSDDSKAVWSPQTDAYAVYAPGAVPVPPPVGAGLESVVCPLRLDEEDDTPNTSPNAIQPGSVPSLPSTPKATALDEADDYMLLSRHEPPDATVTPETVTPNTVMVSDPFSLLGTPPRESVKRQDSHKEQRDASKPKTNFSKHAPSPTASDPVSSSRTRLGSKGSSRSVASRRSPVLPPKVRSREKSSLSSAAPKVAAASTKLVQAATVKSTTLTKAMPASECKPTRSPSTEQDESRSKVQPVVSSAGSGDQPSKPVLHFEPPFAKLIPPVPIGLQQSAPSEAQTTESRDKSLAAQPFKMSGSTNSLSSIEPVMSSATGKVQMTSRGSTSSLSAMDSASRVLSSTVCVSTWTGQAVQPARAELLTPAMATTSSAAAAATSTTSTSDYENLAVGGRASHHSSRTSVGSEKELNYASLDLASSQDETTFPAMAERSPRSPLIGKSSQQAPVNEEEEGDDTPLTYAKIDFTKSEELRAATSLRERVPFDVK